MILTLFTVGTSGDPQWGSLAETWFFWLAIGLAVLIVILLFVLCILGGVSIYLLCDAWRRKRRLRRITDHMIKEEEKNEKKSLLSEEEKMKLEVEERIRKIEEKKKEESRFNNKRNSREPSSIFHHSELSKKLNMAIRRNSNTEGLMKKYDPNAIAEDETGDHNNSSEEIEGEEELGDD